MARRLAYFALLAVTAAAGPGGDPVRVVAEGRAAYIARGKLRVPLPVGDPRYGPVIDASATRHPDGSVDVSVGYNCPHEHTFKFSAAFLESRLENAAALKLHVAKRHAEAAAGFARAVELDPDWALAGTNLAAAQALAGQKAEAVATLARVAGKDPAWVAWRLVADPELAAVAGAPELAAVSTPAGAATAAGLDAVPVAYAAARGLVAFVATNDGDLSDTAAGSLDLVDERSGKTVVSMPLQVNDATCKGACARKQRKQNETWAGQATRTLAVLGFEPVPRASFIELRSGDYEKWRGVFPGTKIGVVGTIAALRVVSGDRVLAETSAAGEKWVWAALLPGRVVAKWNQKTSEDCGRSAMDGIVILRLP